VSGSVPSVSCIVPVFNGAAFLGEAVESVCNQTHKPLEIIVVDDGSTDDTPAVAELLASRITYVRQENAGPAAARNHGLSLARGELVAFLDADDLWHPEKIARQSARFMARLDLEISLTHLRNFWIPELADEAHAFRDHALARDRPGYTAQTLMARRRTFETVGPFDPATRHKDVVGWLLRAARTNAGIELLSDVLAFRRIHHSNLSRQRNAEDAAELLLLAKLLLDQRRARSVAL
jgi:glycosyltransferase involved in cell wall biosynthesis